MEEIVSIALISVAGKLIEDCRKIELLPGGNRRVKNVHGLYEAFNVHLVVSLAVFAYLLSKGAERGYILGSLTVITLGVACKAVFSSHHPERLVWADHDARFGLIIPNGCAIASLLLAILLTYNFSPDGHEVPIKAHDNPEKKADFQP